MSSFRKDTNYQVTKKIIEYMGGKLMLHIEQKIVLIQIIIPLDEEVVNAAQNVKHCDHAFWKAKNKTLFEQFKQML